MRWTRRLPCCVAALIGAVARPAAADDACVPTSVAPPSLPPAAILAAARADLAARRFEDAATAARHLVLHDDRADADVGAAAAKLYIQAIRELGLRTSKRSCFEAIERDAPRLRARFCEGPTRERHLAICAGLDAAQLDAARVAALELVEAAERDAAVERDAAAEASALYARGAERYREAFRTFCDAPSSAGERPDARACTETAYAAARAFRGAGALARALEMYRGLIGFDERRSRGVASAPLVGKAKLELADGYRDLVVYDHAALWYERYAQAHPREPGADRALADAVALRLALGDDVEASRDASLFMKSFTKTSPVLAVQVGVVMATHHVERGELAAARAALVPVAGSIDTAPVDLRLRAHALLARAGVRPSTEHARVRDELRAGDLAARLKEAWPEDDSLTAARRLDAALDAAGAALFFRAEATRAALARELAGRPMPSYAGPYDDAAVKAFVVREVRPRYDRHVEAAEAAEREYRRVLEIEPYAPPRWAALAAARLALGWTDLVELLERTPSLPRDAMEPLIAPVRDNRARPKALACVELAARLAELDVDLDGRGPRSCEVWLTRRWPRERRPHEGVAAPALRAVLDVRQPATRMDGTLLRWNAR